MYAAARSEFRSNRPEPRNIYASRCASCDPGYHIEGTDVARGHSCVAPVPDCDSKDASTRVEKSFAF